MTSHERDAQLDTRLGRAITVEQLLTHRSGLVDYEDLLAADRTAQVLDDEVLALLAAQTAARHEPASRHAYSNSGYVLLGLAAARRAGLSLAALMRREIFDPLGMTGTTLREGEHTLIAHRAYGHSGRARTDQDVTSGHKRAWHSGGTIGFSNHVARYPDLGLAVIVLSNRNAFPAETLANDLAAVVAP